MRREPHVRFCERPVVKSRRPTHPIVGFEHRHEAEQFLANLKARLARFGLNLHPDKTRLIEFGRFANANRQAQGLGKPETFDFLGFTHYCATRRSGSGFVLGRKPVAKRMRTKLREIKEQLMATRHDGIDGQGQWLAQVLRGWMAYYAVPMSGSALSAFRVAVGTLITERPPHRSVRAAFPHTAPTSGPNGNHLPHAVQRL
jgi:hypothetical protein